MENSRKKLLISIIGVVAIGLAGLLMLFLPLYFAFRHEEVTVRTNGYFRYIIVGENSRFQNKEDTAAAIVGFSSLGAEQETIEIPEEIDGHAVEYIGFRDEGFSHNYSHTVTCGEKLKKIYMRGNIQEIAYLDAPNAELIVCSDRFGTDIWQMNVKRVYVSPTVYESGRYPFECSPANLLFLNNYAGEENGGYYCWDHIETGSTAKKPADPTRAGYAFEGWYTEEECVNEWNFETPISITEGEPFRLYAKWREA